MKTKAFPVFGVSIALLFSSLIMIAAPVIAASSDAPVIRVDGQVPASSPVEKADQASISMSSSFGNGAIFYTLDGSQPSAASTRYTGTFTLTATAIRTIRAIAYSIDFSQSAEAPPLEVRIVPGVVLAIISQTAAAGTVTLDPPRPENYRYPSNTLVQVTAVPYAGWQFDHWEGSISSSENPYILKMDGTKSITPVFATSVIIHPAEHGQIHLAPDAKALGSRSVVLTAIPDPGYYFVAWGGDASGSSATTAFAINKSNPQASALFLPLPNPNAVTLTVYTDESQGGKVQITLPTGDDPDADLPYYNVPDGRLVQAIANPGWTFTGWTGDLISLDNPAAARLDSSKVIVGHFAPGFSVNLDVQDGGSVTRTPEQPSYASNSVVQLEAHPQAGFTFAGWSTPSGIKSDNPLSITVTSNVTVAARFDAPPRLASWTAWPGVAFAADQDGNVFTLDPFGLNKRSASGIDQWGVSFTETPNFAPSHDLAIDGEGNAHVAYGGGTALYHEFPEEPPSIDGGIRKISPNGTILATNSYSPVDRIALGADGTIYLVTLRWSAINSPEYPVGGISATTPPVTKWGFSKSWGNISNYTYSFDRYSRPAIGLNGRAYFLASGTLLTRFRSLIPLENGTNEIYCVNAAGEVVWKFPGMQANPTDNAPILSQDSVYAIDKFGWVVALTRDGQRKWRFHLADQVRTPSIGPAGELYFGSAGGDRFYAINPDRSLRWQRQPGRNGYGIPAIGSDGTIYVTDGANSLHALDSNGNRLWTFSTGSRLRDPIIAGTNVYTATASQLIALAANANGAADSPWPMADASPMNDAQERKVLLPPTLDLAAIHLGPDGFHLVIHAEPGATVRIYDSEDLETWTFLHTEVTSDGNYTFVHPSESATQHFYRVSQEIAGP